MSTGSMEISFLGVSFLHCAAAFKKHSISGAARKYGSRKENADPGKWLKCLAERKNVSHTTKRLENRPH